MEGWKEKKKQYICMFEEDIGQGETSGTVFSFLK